MSADIVADTKVIENATETVAENINDKVPVERHYDENFVNEIS